MERYQKIQTDNDEDDDYQAQISQNPSTESTRSTSDASNNMEPDHFDNDGPPTSSGNVNRHLKNGSGSFEEMNISKGTSNDDKNREYVHRYASPQRSLGVQSSQDEWPISVQSDYQSQAEEDSREVKGIGSFSTNRSLGGFDSRTASSFRMLSQEESFSSDDGADLESDDGDDLGRFSFDFNHALGNLELEQEDFGERGENGKGYNDARYIPHHSSDPHLTKRSNNPIMAFLRRFLQAIKRARTQSRQKRIERLLALQDKESYSSKCNFYSSRVELCLSSPWCDLLDKGFVIVIMVILILLIAYFSLDEEEDTKARKFLLAIGIPIIVFRVVWRPLYWILWGRIQERVSPCIQNSLDNFTLFPQLPLQTLL
jgi:hypothetical protein